MPAEKDIDLVVSDRFFANKRDGLLVEVGAARPDFLSIGASFRQKGWKVLSIEPNPVFYQMHLDLGNDVLQYACSDRDADDVDFYVVKSDVGQQQGGTVTFESFSSLGIQGRFAEDFEKAGESAKAEKIKVNVRRLDTILKTHAPNIKEVDILAVDVEGWELSVMRGLEEPANQPRVVILENIFRSHAYRAFMRKRGYVLWRRLKPNEVFVRSDVSLSFRERLEGWLITIFSF